MTTPTVSTFFNLPFTIFEGELAQYLAVAEEQVQRSRCRGAGAYEQVRRSRCRGACAGEQVQWSRCRGACAPRSAEEGAVAPLYCSLHPSLPSGHLWDSSGHPREVAGEAGDKVMVVLVLVLVHFKNIHYKYLII